MKAIILAAGLGTRMGELTKDCPKTMLLIEGQPKLVYSIKSLPQEIEEVIIIIGYLGEQIKRFFGNEYDGRKITYITQENLNGSAGAVILAKDKITEKVLVIMGDDLYDKDDLKEILKYDQALLAYETDKAEKFGLVGIDKDGYLTEVVERPHGKTKGLVNTGAYVLSPEYFKMPMVPISDKEFGLPQTLVSMYPKYKTKVIKTKKWQPVGSPSELALARERIKEFIY